MKIDLQSSIVKLWDYLSVGHSLEKSDVAFVLGRDDFSIPEKTIEIFQNGLTQNIVLLGGRGRLTGDIQGSESEAFKKYLLLKNIPEEVIYLEENSTNTGENIIEGITLVKEKNIQHRKISLITHGPHMRRALAVAKAQDSSIDWIPCPDTCRAPNVASLDFQKAAWELVGEVSRLQTYPKLGYFEDQHIPDNIISAKDLVESCLSK